MALDAYKMRIVAQGLKVLRQKVVMLRLVNQDFSLEARSKNEVIIIPESSAQTVHNVSASRRASGTQAGQPQPARVAARPMERIVFRRHGQRRD